MRQSKHAVRHLKCCLVWISKCHRGILKTEIAEYTRSVFQKVAGKYAMIVDAMAALKDHVYIFLKPPLGFLPLVSCRL
jgi:REP element-mobilizing transposase RayT